MTHLFPEDLAGLQATWRWKTRDAGQGAGSAIHNKSTNVLGGKCLEGNCIKLVVLLDFLFLPFIIILYHLNFNVSFM